MPLFARKGFAGTTTKEIAEAARVSEALVFKHFPSKAALYQEIVQQGCLGDPALERLSALPASTATLVGIVRFMLRHFIVSAADSTCNMHQRQRLMLNSFLDDGEYARLAYVWVAETIYPKIAECFAAAAASGDLVELPITFENRFWFAQHVASTMAYVRLSGRCDVPYRGDLDCLIDEASWFVLRGLGLRDDIIAQHRASEVPAAAAD